MSRLLDSSVYTFRTEEVVEWQCWVKWSRCRDTLRNSWCLIINLNHCYSPFSHYYNNMYLIFFEKSQRAQMHSPTPQPLQWTIMVCIQHYYAWIILCTPPTFRCIASKSMSTELYYNIWTKASKLQKNDFIRHKVKIC